MNCQFLIKGEKYYFRNNIAFVGQYKTNLKLNFFLEINYAYGIICLSFYKGQELHNESNKKLEKKEL